MPLFNPIRQFLGRRKQVVPPERRAPFPVAATRFARDVGKEAYGILKPFGEDIGTAIRGKLMEPTLRREEEAAKTFAKLGKQPLATRLFGRIAEERKRLARPAQPVSLTEGIPFKKQLRIPDVKVPRVVRNVVPVAATMLGGLSAVGKMSAPVAGTGALLKGVSAIPQLTRFGKFAGLSTALGAGIGGIFGGKEGARAGAVRALPRSLPTYGMIRATEPALAPLMQKLPSQTPRIVSERLVPAILNVIQGIGVDIARGEKPLTAQSLAIDIGTGLVFGQASVAGRPDEMMFKLSDAPLQQIKNIVGQQEGFIRIPPTTAPKPTRPIVDITKGIQQLPPGSRVIEPPARPEVPGLLKPKISAEGKPSLEQIADRTRGTAPGEAAAIDQRKFDLRRSLQRPTQAGIVEVGKQPPVPPRAPPPEVPPKPEAPTTTLGKIQQGFEAGRKARQIRPRGAGIRTQLLDKFTPLYDLVKQAKKELPTEINPYKRIRLLAGLEGKVEIELKQGLEQVLNRNVKQLDDLSSLLIMDRTREIARYGKKTFLSETDITKGTNELIAKHGQDGFNQLEQSAQEVRNFGNTLLERLRDSGIIDDASFNRIKAKNEFYVPFQVVEHISDSLEKGRFIRTSYNVASQDVIKRLKGSEKALGDPLEGLVQKTSKVIALTERNKAMQQLVDLRNVDPVFKDLIKPHDVKESIPEGMDVVRLFVNGKNVEYTVPEGVAAAIKNLDKEASNILVRMLKPQASLLRKGTVIYNVGFIPINAVRDMQNAMFQTGAESGIKGTAALVYSYPAALFSTIGEGKLWQQWLKDGGGYGTLTSHIFKRPQVTVRTLAGVKEPAFKQVATSIPHAIRKIGQIIEESTRLARDRAGIKYLGESSTEAVFKSRDVTVDFSKSGTVTRSLNTVVPFLNANIQGAERLAHIWKTNPKQAAMMGTILAGIPATILYMLNKTFPDYEDIPQYRRDLDWIFMYNQRSPEEIANREPLYAVRLAKGQIISPIANITENALRYLSKNNPRKFTELVASVFEDISPVGFPYNKEALGKTLSRITPPVLRGGIEAVTGTNLFTGQPVVPEYLQRVAPEEQFTKRTPEIYKKAGQLFKQSPRKIESFVRTATGGVGQQLAELASGNIKRGTTGQIQRRFTEVYGGEQVGKQYDQLRGFEEERATISLKERRVADKILDEIVAEPTKAGRQAILAKYQDQMNPRVEKRLEEIAGERLQHITSIERSLKNASVYTRARVIYAELQKIETKTERAHYVKRMRDIKILTSGVEEELERVIQENQ